MKNKKTLYTIIITCIVLIAQVIVYFTFLSNNKNSDYTNLEVKNGTIENLRESSVEIPKYNIKMSGYLDSSFNDELVALENLKLYEFEVGMETDWGVKSGHYVGYKLKDVLSMYKIPDYKEVVVKKAAGMEVTYPKELINTDTIYLVFYRNEKDINGGIVTALSTSDNYGYSVEDIYEIEVN